MYTVSDIVEIGKAQEFILSELKDWFVLDDCNHLSMAVDPPWDEWISPYEGSSDTATWKGEDA